MRVTGVKEVLVSRLLDAGAAGTEAQAGYMRGLGGRRGGLPPVRPADLRDVRTMSAWLSRATA
eukprot:344257-Lingulodinium_polyedra.AAC.1